MVIDKNYFLNRMRNGESIDQIGENVADMMNEAVEAYEAERAIRKNTEARRKLVRNMIDDINELAKLDGCGDLGVSLTDEEADDLVQSFTEMFKVLSVMKQTADALNRAAANTQKPVQKDNDDVALANFLHSLGL